MRFNSFYQNEFIYKGWKVMILKPGVGSLVSVNFWPGIDLEKVKLLKNTNKELHDKIFKEFTKNCHGISLKAPGYNPNFSAIVAQARVHVDTCLGPFDLNKMLSS